MRIYLPATLPRLRQAVTTGVFHPPSGVGFAVTDALVAEYPAADAEDLEYLSMHDASLASLRLIAGGGVEPVRVVLAIDEDAVADGKNHAEDRDNAEREGETDGAGTDHDVTVTERDDLDRAVVKLRGAIRWDAVAAVHLDGGDVADVIRAAADAVDAADMGDMDAAVVVGDAEDIDLAWYAPGEIRYLLTQLGLS